VGGQGGAVPGVDEGACVHTPCIIRGKGFGGGASTACKENDRLEDGTEHVVLGWLVDTEAGTISLPEQKVQDLRERLAEWPPHRKQATVREVLVLAGKLHHAAFVIRPGRYFVHRLLQLAGLHLNGMERAGGGDAWGRHRRKAHARKVVQLTWQRWGGGDGISGKGRGKWVVG